MPASIAEAHPDDVGGDVAPRGNERDLPTIGLPSRFEEGLPAILGQAMKVRAVRMHGEQARRGLPLEVGVERDPRPAA